MQKEKADAYWKENLTYISILLAIWFGVSYFDGILVVDQLDAMTIGGFPLGFWFARLSHVVVASAMLPLLHTG